MSNFEILKIYIIPKAAEAIFKSWETQKYVKFCDTKVIYIIPKAAKAMFKSWETEKYVNIFA